MVRLLCLLCFTLPAFSAEVTTLTGTKYTGTFVGISEGSVKITTDKGPLSLPVKELASIDFGVKAPSLEGKPFDEIELIDGSVLRISGLKLAGKKFEPTALQANQTPNYDVPMETVFTLLRGADAAKNREEWKKLVAGRGKRDLFVFRQPDGLSPVPGTILGGSEGNLEFERESDNQKVTFRLVRATGGLVFNQPPRGIIPPTLCKLHDTLGNVLVVTSISGTDALVVKTVSGATLTYPDRAVIAKLDFSTGNVAYLADIEPTVNAPQPVAGEPNWTWLKDRTPDGPGFRINSVAYSKGVWIAPDVALTWKLNGDYREFKTMAGVEDSITIATSAVKLMIEADGKPVFSETITRAGKPKELTLDVKNVKVLKISIEGEGLFLGNQITLADARLQK